MYTGIVDHLGNVVEKISRGNSIQLSINCNFTDIQEGESIAINGVCVTVIEPQRKQFKCDISPETLKLTNLQFINENDQVNLERSLALGDRFGGHFVMGHVDAMATVCEIQEQGEFVKISFAGFNKEQMAFFVKKGSVAINGVSLTINEINRDGFSVMLIPHTLERTNLQFLKLDDVVNIEYDTLARMVVNQVQQYLLLTKELE